MTVVWNYPTRIVFGEGAVSECGPFDDHDGSAVFRPSMGMSTPRSRAVAMAVS